ncbi:MAG: hypothetical protein RIC35_23605 [Marinoscillum sp.]
MNLQLNHAGRFLLSGAVMIIITMALHPVGGSIEHLQSVRSMIIGTHTLAILSVPILIIGFWGITQILGKDQWINLLAFVIICVGLIAVMIAAATNGLVVPFFLDQANPDLDRTILSLILKYSFSLNKAMDYIFIGSCCLSVGLWSASIVRTNKLPKWLGLVGILLSLGAIISIVAGLGLTDLLGFRTFIFGLALWILAISTILMRK